MTHPAASRLVTALALLFGLAACSTTSDEPSPMVEWGEVTDAQGFPRVSRNSNRYILAPQSRIYRADILNTDEESRLEFTLSDGSLIGAGPDSHVVLHAYAPGDQLELQLTRGSLFAAPARGTRVRLRTSMATVNLQAGSSYAVLAQNILDVGLVDGGRMNVSNDNGQIEITSARSATSVRAGSAPQEVFNWTERRVERLADNVRVVDKQALVPAN